MPPAGGSEGRSCWALPGALITLCPIPGHARLHLPPLQHEGLLLSVESGILEVWARSSKQVR
eukprot:4838163-Pyramimonas_sp.AAC.1